VHAPSTDSSALNPSELAARGAAIQASLVSEFDIEDIEQSVHPAVTVAPHLGKDIGVVVIGPDGAEQFQSLLPAQTALPGRKTAELLAPSQGGDVVVKFVEGVSEIRRTVPEKTPQANGEKEDGEGEDNDSDLGLSDDEEEIKSKHMKIDTLLAEALLKGVGKGRKIEVTVNAAVDGSVAIAARVSGTQQGVRGTLKTTAA